MAVSGCRDGKRPAPASGSGDATFARLATDVLEETYRRQPTQATYLGIHKYDDTLEDYSRQEVANQLEALRRLRGQVEAVDAGDAVARQTTRSRAGAARARLADADAGRHPALGKGPGHLQQRPHQHGLHHDQAELRAARRAVEAADRPREGDAGRAGRGAEEPRQPASYLRRNRHRATRRQPRFLPERHSRGVQRRQGPGIAVGVQDGERGSGDGARRLQDVASAGSPAARQGRVRVRRRHLQEEAVGR